MEATTQHDDTPGENGAELESSVQALKTPTTGGGHVDNGLQTAVPAELAGSEKPEGSDQTSQTSIPRVTHLFRELTKEAAERVEAVPVKPGVELDDQNQQALFLVELIRSAEERTQNMRAIQAWATVEASRAQIWLAYPVTPDAPYGVGSLRELLELAGMNRREVYSMNLLGKTIVPFCDDNDLEITSLIQHHYPKLVEVIPQLGRQIRDDNSTPQDIKRTLDAVTRMQSRAHMRDWRQLEPEKDLIAVGAVHHLSSGQAVITLVLKSKDDLDRVVPRLGSTVRWDLVAGVKLKGSVLHIVVDDLLDSLGVDDEVGAAPSTALLQEPAVQ